MLGVVEGFVRALKKLLHCLYLGRVAVEHGYARANGNMQVVFFNISFRIADKEVEILNDLAKTVYDRCHHMGMGARSHKGKFVAPKAASYGLGLHVKLFTRPLDVCAHNLEHLIANKVPVGVVEVFEVVDVKQGNGHGLPLVLPS